MRHATATQRGSQAIKNALHGPFLIKNHAGSVDTISNPIETKTGGYMQARWPRRLRQHSGMHARLRETGAVLVELAFSVIVLSTLSMGVAEYGSLFSAAIDLSAGVRSAAQTGAATGTTAVSDKAIIESALDQRGGTDRIVQRIVIYKADPTKPGPPQTCKTTTARVVAHLCNIYFPADFGMTAEQMAAATAGGWPASERQLGKEFLGVWVDIRKSPIQRLVWAPNHVADYQVALLDETRAPSQATATNSFGPGPQTKHVATPDDFETWTGQGTTGTYNGGTPGSGTGGGS